MIGNLKTTNYTKNDLLKRDILSYFVANGNSTIQELAKDLGLSVPTISKAIGELGDMGCVSEYGKQETGEGRKPILYGLNATSGYFVGVELKEHFVNVGLMDFRGELVELASNIAFTVDNTAASIDRLCDIVAQFIAQTEVPKDRVENITFCVPGRINPMTGCSYTFFNFTEQPLASILSEKLGYPVSIENDTRAFAYAEFVQGNAAGAQNTLFVNMGWGIGLGIIINGNLYEGKSGFSGEIGHTHIFNNGILCHCGKKGCLETEVSGRAFKRIVEQRINGGEASLLSQMGNKEVTVESLIEATNQEDPLCIEVLEGIGQKIGESIANLINIFNPELVVIGGVLAHTGEFLLQPIRVSVMKYSLSIVNRDTKLCLSKLKDRGGVIGACLLSRKSVLG